MRRRTLLVIIHHVEAGRNLRDKRRRNKRRRRLVSRLVEADLRARRIDGRRAEIPLILRLREKRRASLIKYLAEVNPRARRIDERRPEIHPIRPLCERRRGRSHVCTRGDHEANQQEKVGSRKIIGRRPEERSMIIIVVAVVVIPAPWLVGKGIPKTRVLLLKVPDRLGVLVPPHQGPRLILLGHHRHQQ